MNLQDITGISSDSREIKPGFAFFAINAKEENGITFIQDAISRGASIIVLQNDIYIEEQNGILYYYVDSVRLELARWATQFFSKKPKHIMAITGTNGKTSVVEICRNLTSILQKKSGSIGTLGAKSDALSNIPEINNIISGFTTPPAHKINQALELMSDLDYVAIEASSHGLEQHRIDFLPIDVAGFTNLSHDHLDYHKSQKKYFTAKSRLFSEILQEGKTAVLNFDCKEFKALERICQKRHIKIIKYAKTNNADINFKI
ncbi:MAG: Mur ligase family protein, partial [Proteobacteria bacterium]|nr:Mur ligase family protein [Pseudomonadota bacterium]